MGDEAAWDLFHRECAHDWFDQLAGRQNDSLPAELVAADSTALTAAIAPVKLFVEKRLAHQNHPQYDPELSHAEISTAIDLIGSLFRKYTRLVRQVDPRPLTDNTNWGAAFTVAWNPGG